MGPVTRRQFATAMWWNRPTTLEMLLWTVIVLFGHWATGWPLPLLAVAVVLVLLAGTAQMAVADLRAEFSSTGGGEHAD